MDEIDLTFKKYTEVDIFITQSMNCIHDRFFLTVFIFLNKNIFLNKWYVMGSELRKVFLV